MVKKILLITALFTALYSSVAFAAPTVTSVTEGSGEIQITGTSFGAHIDYSSSNSDTIARAWNNFENGNLLNNDWYHDYSGAFSENWTLVTGSPNRTNSNYLAARNYVNDTRGGIAITQTDDFDEWYGTFWINISSTCPTGGSQGKFSRIFGDNGNTFFSPVYSTNRVYGFYNLSSGGGTGADGINFNEWHRVEYFMKQSTTTTQAFLDGKLQWTKTDQPFSNMNGGGHTWAFGSMIEDIKNTCYHRFDDVYFDHTRARVEVCETGGAWSTAATKHCEVQVPKSWSSTYITVSPNNGTFSTNDTAYLYVIDSNGDASDPEEITIGSGGSSDTTNPTLSSATVDDTGLSIDLVFDEAVVATGYTSGDFDLDCSTAGSNILLSSPSGSGINWSFTIGTTVNSGDTCDIDFNGATDSIEDTSGNDLSSISSGSVTVVGYTSDTTNPTLSSATVDSSGLEVDLVFDESVVSTGYTSGDFDLDCTTAGSNISLSSPTGSGTTWSFTIATTVYQNDTCSIDYNGATDGIEDSVGNDLLQITDGSVTVVGYLLSPEITSASENNGEITISGSSFGTHLDYSSSNSNTLARAWNNFETGYVIRDDWEHAYSGLYSDNWQALTGATNRANSTYFAARNNSVGSVEGALEIYTSIQPTEWYSSMYLQISDTCPTTSPRGQFTRVWGDSSEAMYLQPDGSSNYLSGTFANIGSSEVGTVETLGTNTWHRVEMYMNKTSQEVSTYIDGKLQWTRNDWPSATFQAQNHTWDIGVYIEQVTNTCYHRFDDVYFDHTPARVEICETGGAWSTTATKHCEVQIPTSWASDSITVTSNHGTFDVNDSVYLYVINESGEVSDPYSLTLTDIGGGEAPSGQGIFSGGFGAIDTGGTGSFQ